MFRKKSVLTCKLVLLLLTLAFMASYTSALDTKLNIRWRTSFPEGFQTFDVANIDEDESLEVIAADSNNTIHIFNSDGSVEGKITLPPNTEIGSVQVIRISDLDGDRNPEIILGFGGKKDAVTHPWNEYYNYMNESVGRYSRVHYRTTRISGELRVINLSGATLWRVQQLPSVNDIKVFDVNLDGKEEVLVGTGSFVLEEYWEHSYGGSEEGEVWDLVEYQTWNASSIMLDSEGKELWNLKLYSNEKSNKVRAIDAGDLIGDERIEVLVSTDDGTLYLLNESGGINRTHKLQSGIYFMRIYDLSETTRKDVLLGLGDNTIEALDSDFNLLWRYKLPKIPNGMYGRDIDQDGSTELFIGGRDNNIYVFYENGALRWKQFISEPAYTIMVSDLDQDEIIEVIVGSDVNLTVFDFDREYITREIGYGYYDRANEMFRVGNLLLSKIYAQKARDLLLIANDLSGIPKIDFLLKRIDEEKKLDRKTEAEYYYGQALETYGKNRYDESKLYVLQARDIYVEVGDEPGIGKVDLLFRQIEDEIKLVKSLRAKSSFDAAVSYFGFRNFTAAKIHAENARDVYAEIGDEAGVLDTNEFIIKIGEEYLASAKRKLIGLDYDGAREQATLAKELYLEYNYSRGVEAVLEFELEIQEHVVNEPNPVWEVVNKILPYVLIILIIFLIYSFMSKRKEELHPTQEESISDELEHELEEVI